MKQPTTKPDLSYVPYEALLAIAQAFEYGTIVNGHPREDWRASESSEPYLAAMARHVAQRVNKREQFDPESGIDHLALAMANAIMALCIDGYEYQKPVARELPEVAKDYLRETACYIPPDVQYGLAPEVY